MYTAKQRTLLELFKKQNDDARKLVGISKTAATLAKYDRCYRRMEEFMKYQYKFIVSADFFVGKVRCIKK